MTGPDTALMSPGHVCSLYHCIDSVWTVWRCWRGRNPGQTASTRTAPLLSHRSSPAATCATTSLHRAEKLSTTATTFLPPQAGPGLYLHCHLKSQVALSFVLCIRNNIITSSNIVPAVFQDTHVTHVLDNNCV